MVRLLNVRGRPWVDATIAAVKYAGGEWSIDVDAAYRLSTALAGLGGGTRAGIGVSSLDGGAP
jgi:hypothetical protein